LFGITSYLPLYAQGVLNGRAVDAGRVLMPMAVVWPVGSTLGGWLILRLGYRASVTLGTILVFGGALALLSLRSSSPQWQALPPMGVIGLGMGFSVTAFVIAVQHAVGWEQRGLATGTAQFARSIGGSVGVALFGAVLNSRVHHSLATLDLLGAGRSGEARSAVDALMDPAARAGIAPEILGRIQLGLADALHSVFALAAGAAALAIVVAWFFPAGRVVAHPSAEAPSPPAPLPTTGRGG
jgi:hypothetical protein